MIEWSDLRRDLFTLVFETGDERDAWLGRIVAVAKGCLDAADPSHLLFSGSQLR